MGPASRSFFGKMLPKDLDLSNKGLLPFQGSRSRKGQVRDVDCFSLVIKIPCHSFFIFLTQPLEVQWFIYILDKL